MRYENYIYHHGIQGQKWGVRNGPPYPLSRNSIKEETSYGSLTSLAFSYTIHGAERLAQSGYAYLKTKKYDFDLQKMPNEIDEKSGLRLKVKEMTEMQDLARTNPGYLNMDKGTKNNCANCSMAYDLRRRGYEVRADLNKEGVRISDIKSMYKNVTDSGRTYLLDSVSDRFNPVKKNGRITDLLTDLKGQGNGARGFFLVNYSFGHTKGHAMIYEINNGKVIVRDAQSNKTYNNVKSLLKKDAVSGVEYIRIDNSDPDYKKLKEYVL